MSELYVVDKQPRRTGALWVWAVVLIVVLLVVGLGWWGLRQRADNAATDRVSTVLANEGATAITVSVSGGKATLTGTLPQGLNAEELKNKVSQVEGISTVITNVVSPGPAAPLAPAAPITAPSSGSTAPSQGEQHATPANLDVVVTLAQVTLSGTVPDDQIKTSIIKAAQAVHGSQHVTENLQIDESVDSQGLDQIPSLFKALGARSAVQIGLRDGQISMAGTVAAQPQRSATEKVATAVTGDKAKVRNDLVVGYATQYSTSAAQLALNALPKIEFPANVTTVGPQAKKTLAQAAQIIIKNPSLEMVEVESHTHGEAPAGQAKALTEKRAQAAVDELVRLGVPRNRLKPEGLGESRPLVANDYPDHDAINTRMQFEIEV